MAAIEFLFDRLADALAVAPRGVLGALAGAYLGFQAAHGPGAIGGMMTGLLSGLYFDGSESLVSKRFGMPFVLVALAVIAFAIAQWFWH